MTNKEAKDRLISLRTSYKIRIEEEDIEALDKGIEALENQKSFIDELEKMKEKINSEDVNCQYEEDYVYSSGLQKAIELIDNRLEELKGEQE